MHKFKNKGKDLRQKTIPNIIRPQHIHKIQDVSRLHIGFRPYNGWLNGTVVQ